MVVMGPLFLGKMEKMALTVTCPALRGLWAQPGERVL